jgi:aminocarboxymuconate-semialdehyde decarboxylase
LIVIDIHSHLFFSELFGLAGDLGPRIDRRGDGTIALVTGGYSFPMGKRTTIDTIPQRRIAELDAAGIEVQLVSGSPLWFFHHSTAEVAIRFSRAFNEALAQFAASSPARFKAIGVLPMQHPAASLAELERAVRELGVAGAMIGTDAWPRLDDPDLDELYSAFEELDVPLLVHSTIAGVDGPPPEKRFARFKNELTIALPFQETEAGLTLVFGGVLRRHPRLRVCLPHGAGTLPYLYGRLRAFMASLPDAPVTVGQFEEDFGRLWFDTHVHGAGQLRLLTETVSRDRLVFGTNFGGWDTGSARDLDGFDIDTDANARALFSRAFMTAATLAEEPVA